jgi:hypothetical protein
LEKIEYGLLFKALQNLNEAKKNWGAYLFFSLFSFLFVFLFFLSSSFFLSFLHFFFSLFFIFLFFIFMLLQTFKQQSTCYSSPPPCLNDCSSSSIEVRGPMADREVQNPFSPL